MDKRCFQCQARIQSLNAEWIIENEFSDCCGAGSADSEYFSESALFTDGGLSRAMKGPKANNGNCGRVYAMHLASRESSSSEGADESILSDRAGEEGGDSLSGDASSDDGQDNAERDCGDSERADRETIPCLSRAAVPDDEQSTSDDGYHVDYDDDDGEVPAVDFFNAEGDTSHYPIDAAFGGDNESTDGYDTDYDDEWHLRIPCCDSPNIDECNQRINEYLWSTM